MASFFREIGRKLLGDDTPAAEPPGRQSPERRSPEDLLKADEGVVAERLRVLQQERDDLGIADEYLQKKLPADRYGELHQLVETLSHLAGKAANDIRQQPDDIRRTDLTLHTFPLVVKQLRQCVDLVKSRAPKDNINAALGLATKSVRNAIDAFKRLNDQLLHIDNDVATEGTAAAIEEITRDPSQQ